MGMKKLNRDVLTRRLIEAYQDTGLNQVGFADKVKITQATVSRYLNGATPDLKALVQLATCLGISVDWLLGLTEKKKLS